MHRSCAHLQMLKTNFYFSNKNSISYKPNTIW
jgi:hypothetical protein